MSGDMLCMHCLEEGDWQDEDKCPKCTGKGHTSPWTVGGCPRCNADFSEKMAELVGRVELRSNFNAVIANLQRRVKELEDLVGNLSRRLTNTGTERIG